MIGSDDSRDYGDRNKDVGWNPLGIGRTALTDAPASSPCPCWAVKNWEEMLEERQKNMLEHPGCQISIPKKQRASFDTTDLCTGTSFTLKNAFGLFVALLCGLRLPWRQDGGHQSPLLIHSLPERAQRLLWSSQPKRFLSLRCAPTSHQKWQGCYAIRFWEPLMAYFGYRAPQGVVNLYRSGLSKRYIPRIHHLKRWNP